MPPRFNVPVLQFPAPGYTRQFAYGGTAALALSDDGKKVLKFPFKFETQYCNERVAARARSQMEESQTMLEREKEIYQHLGLRPGILAPIEISSVGLVFPFYKNGDLRAYLQKTWGKVGQDQVMVWAEEAVERISFTQSMGVYQCDISTRNFLVGDDLSLVLNDFSGSRLGSKPELVGPETSYAKALQDDQYGTVQGSMEGEVFSIGSLLYEIVTGRKPYSDLSDEEIEDLFRQGKFPPTSTLVLGSIIEGCWMGRYCSAEEVKAGLEAAKNERV
jgi:serine/threonine protein kinase